MPRDPLIGLVGKPSSGKSTTLNRYDNQWPPQSLSTESSQLDRRQLQSWQVKTRSTITPCKLTMKQVTFRKPHPIQYLLPKLIRSSFTTIDPQRAIGYLQISCACARFNVSDRCKPNYGSCVDGKRSVPIELLDVAGLVPGAHQGKGLGNKFLDDLRHADALIHVVDVSGTTDAEGA